MDVYIINGLEGLDFYLFLVFLVVILSVHIALVLSKKKIFDSEFEASTGCLILKCKILNSSEG